MKVWLISTAPPVDLLLHCIFCACFTDYFRDDREKWTNSPVTWLWQDGPSHTNAYLIFITMFTVRVAGYKEANEIFSSEHVLQCLLLK